MYVVFLTSFPGFLQPGVVIDEIVVLLILLVFVVFDEVVDFVFPSFICLPQSKLRNPRGQLDHGQHDTTDTELRNPSMVRTKTNLGRSEL